MTVGQELLGLIILDFSCNPEAHPLFCDPVRKVVSDLVYTNAIQSFLVQAEYWHDPMHPDKYAEKSQFIAEINNEGSEMNAEYADNLKNLEHFVMVKFADDSMVFPRETSHFGFYADGTGKNALPLQETKNYLEDRLGLKTMDEQGKLVFLSIPGDHLNIPMTWFVNEIIHKYLI